MPPKRDQRPPAAPRIVNGRKVWDRWGRTACYNSRGDIRPAARHCHKPCRPGVSEAKIAAGKKTAWIAALHEYNRKSPIWCVPKINTPGYDECMNIKDRIEEERRPRQHETRALVRRRSAATTIQAAVRRALLLEKDRQGRAPRTPAPRTPVTAMVTRSEARRLTSALDLPKMSRAPRVMLPGGSSYPVTEAPVTVRRLDFGEGTSKGPSTAAYFSARKTRSGRPYD